MFNPTLHRSGNTSHRIEVNNSVAAVYLHSRRPVNLSEVGLLELLHTLFNDTAVVTADPDPQPPPSHRGVGRVRGALSPPPPAPCPQASNTTEVTTTACITIPGSPPTS